MRFKLYHDRDCPVIIEADNDDSGWIALPEWSHTGTIEECLVGLLRDIEALAAIDEKRFQKWHAMGKDSRYTLAIAVKAAARKARLKLETETEEDNR